MTWGINPGQAISIDEQVPTVEGSPEEEKALVDEALVYMKLEPGSAIKGTPIDVAFMGSCTNGRLSDFIEASRFLQGAPRGRRRHGYRRSRVPGSQRDLPGNGDRHRSSARPALTGETPVAPCAWP